MKRPRDSKRQRLYDSERCIQSAGGEMSIAECQSYVDALTKSAWFVRRWGRRTIEIEWGRGGGHAYAGNFIRLGVWARQEVVVLHELAHCLTPGHYAAHGAEFAGVMLTLVRHKLGNDTARKLRESYRAHRVKVSMRAVPKPKQERVENQRRMIQATKAAASRPPLHRELGDAAAIIRRAAQAGHFGPSGRKSRAHALETARRLEERQREERSMNGVVHLGAAMAPWDRVYQELIGFGWSNPEDIEAALRKRLEAADAEA